MSNNRINQISEEELNAIASYYTPYNQALTLLENTFNSLNQIRQDGFLNFSNSQKRMFLKRKNEKASLTCLENELEIFLENENYKFPVNFSKGVLAKNNYYRSFITSTY